MKKQSARIAVTLVAAAALQACVTAGAYFGSTTPPGDEVLIISNQTEPRSLDPHKSAGVPEANIFINLFEGLTTYDPRTGSPIPALATSWEKNSDASMWTFHLRHDATWTDGTPVTADDFVYSWRRIADPKTASPYANMVYYVKNAEAINQGKITDLTQLGVRAVDPYTLEVTMERPTAFFVAMTPHYAFCTVPRQAIEKYGDAWVNDPETLVSDGPFRLVKRVAAERVVLEKWEQHWDAKNVRLKRIVYLPVDEQNTAVNLYKANEVYGLAGGGQTVPTSFVRALKGKRDFYINPIYGVYYYSINVNRKPLDDPRVRRALNMSIDKRAICEDYLGAGQVPATNFVPPGTPGYPYPAADGYDPEEARRLLAEAGFPGGKNFPKIEIFFNTLESHRQLAELIQRMWKEQLNIPVELNNQEWQVFQATRESRDFDIARDGWFADYLDPNSFLDLHQTLTLNNHAGWLDARYTKLMEQANAEPDQERRLALLAQAEAVLLEQTPVIPIYYYASVKLKKPFVEGWYDNPLDYHPAKFMWINNDWKPGDPDPER